MPRRRSRYARTHLVLCKLVGQAERPTRGAGHNPAHATAFHLVPGELAEGYRLPTASATPAAIGAHTLQVSLSVRGEQESRAELAGQQPARRTDVPHYLGARQNLCALGTPARTHAGTCNRRSNHQFCLIFYSSTNQSKQPKTRVVFSSSTHCKNSLFFCPSKWLHRVG